MSDLIGLIIEATGLQAEVGEVCMVGERPRPPAVAAEVVGFRDGRTLLMPLGELHGIGPGTIVNPTGAPFRVAVGEPLLGRVIDGLGNPLDGMPTPAGRSDAHAPPALRRTLSHARGSPSVSGSASARSTRWSRVAAVSASASSPARASASPRCWA